MYAAEPSASFWRAVLDCQSGVWNKQGNGIGTSQVGYGNTIGSCNGRVGLTYSNATNKSRIVMVTMVNGLAVNSYAWINGVVVASQYGWGGGLLAPYTLLVPPGASYAVSGGTRCDAWTEWQ